MKIVKRRILCRLSLVLIIASGCQPKGSNDSPDPTPAGKSTPGPQPSVTGTTCDELISVVKGANRKQESLIAKEIALYLSDAPTFDSNLASQCLDQHLNLACSESGCGVTDKKQEGGN